MEKSKTQSDLKIRYCKAHPKKEINGFCEECKEFFCIKCVMNHLEHKGLKKLETFCKERKESVLSQISFKELPPQLEKKNEEMVETREKLDKELEDTNKDVTLKEGVIKGGKEEVFKEEMRLIEAATRYLVELEDKASSIALRDACEDAMELFNIEDKIRQEF